jgi:hypothetical protein
VGNCLALGLLWWRVYDRLVDVDDIVDVVDVGAPKGNFGL